MPRWLLLILGVLILYLAPSLALKAVYGPSYDFISSDNGWIPDENGGWQPKGFPDHPRPTTPSENVPFLIEIAPIVMPLLLILLFLLSPLAQYVEREPRNNSGSFAPEKYYPEYIEAESEKKSEFD